MDSAGPRSRTSSQGTAVPRRIRSRGEASSTTPPPRVTTGENWRMMNRSPGSRRSGSARRNCANLGSAGRHSESGARAGSRRSDVSFPPYNITVATVMLYGGKETSDLREPARAPDSECLPAEPRLAQLRLAEPLLLLPGDRFIIRQFSPVVTLGGGVVLDASRSE